MIWEGSELISGSEVTDEAGQARLWEWLGANNRFMRLTELDVIPIPDDFGTAEVSSLLALFPQGNKQQNPLDIEIAPTVEDGRIAWRLCASNKVGVWSVRNPAEPDIPVTIVVSPKVEGAAFLTMLSFAFCPSLLEREGRIDAADSPAESILLLMFMDSVGTLIMKGGLQREYIRRELDLRGTIRGTPLLAAYLQRHVPTAKAHIVPCRYWEFCVDNLPNRALRWGVELCRETARQFCPAVSGRIEEQWKYIEPFFGSVQLAEAYGSQVRRISRTGRFVHYSDSLEFLEFLLDSLFLETRAGQVRVRGFAFNMAEVFERFVINVLRSEKLNIAGHDPHDYIIRDHKTGAEITKGKIILDARLSNGIDAVVMDTKWKEALLPVNQVDDQPESSLQLENLRVKNPDLFQVVAYARHKSVRARCSILVYPVLNDEQVCRVRVINDFLHDFQQNIPLPIFLIGVPLGKTTMMDSRKDFARRIREICHS